jgi:kinesin family protein 5
MLLKRQLTDSQILANESNERAKKSQEEIELLSRRKEELENRLSLLEQDYEDLLERASAAVGAGGMNTGEDVNELESIKAKLDAQTALKREATLVEITDLKQQLDIKVHENRSLIVTIDNMKSANEELKVCLFGFPIRPHFLPCSSIPLLRFLFCFTL